MVQYDILEYLGINKDIKYTIMELEKLFNRPKGGLVTPLKKLRDKNLVNFEYKKMSGTCVRDYKMFFIWAKV
jgi:hypothetical protein